MVRPSSAAARSPPSTDAPADRKRWRRLKANHRERTRMHDLNRAMDVLRQRVPLAGPHQKLSKIETLRLACNYIAALDRVLHTGHPPGDLEFARLLSAGMSQPTANLIASLFDVPPRVLHAAHQETPQQPPIRPSTSPPTPQFASPVPFAPPDCSYFQHAQYPRSA
ncbi:Neurogenic differentiation factor 1 [Aphelenchoides fujianensis]|nr:Neurogenic differentiation factor 1 [Aphelenchoides fujianensis]